MTVALRSFPWLLAILLALGCDGAVDDDTGDDDVADDDDSATDDDDDTGATPDPPCSDGTWGYIVDPDAAIHVRADGDDATGDGSAANPVASLERALELSREPEGGRTIAVGPGTFPTSIDIQGEPGEDPDDTGLAIEGCGAGDTVLTAADAQAHVIRVSESTGVRLAGFTTEGGRRALWIWNGAEVTVEAVDVTDSLRLGVVLGGFDSIVSLVDVTVHDPVVEAEGEVEYGYGIAIQEAAVTMSGGGVYNANRVGILAHMALVDLDGVTIDGTASDSDGYLGRGIQLQDLSVASLTGCSLSGNRDAGLFSLRSVDLVLDGLTVDGTGAADVPGSGDTTGDGIVLTQGDGNYDPAEFQATLTQCVVTASDRAGILIEDVTATLTDNTAGTDNGMSDDDTSIYVQGDAVVNGVDDTAVPATSLVLNQIGVETDSLSD